MLISFKVVYSPTPLLPTVEVPHILHDRVEGYQCCQTYNCWLQRLGLHTMYYFERASLWKWLKHQTTALIIRKPFSTEGEWSVFWAWCEELFVFSTRRINIFIILSIFIMHVFYFFFLWQLCSIPVVLIIILVLLFIAPLFYHLPKVSVLCVIFNNIRLWACDFYCVIVDESAGIEIESEY